MYLMISCHDVDIMTDKFDNFDDACSAMKEEYNDFCDKYEVDKNNCFMCGINDSKSNCYAYVKHGYLPDCSWRIIEV